MRGAQRLVLVVALVVPLLIAGLGWPLFVRWLERETATAPQAETATVVATPTTTGAAQPTATPIPAPAEPPAPVARQTTTRAVVPEATRVSQGAQADTGPKAAVATFYELVGRHDFDTAAQLWTPRMRAAFPPPENIDQRFADTQTVVVNRVEVVAARGDSVVVAVDLDEQQSAGRRHYVGTWSVVRDGNGWLLDQPNLEATP